MTTTQIIHRAALYAQSTAESTATIAPEHIADWLPSAYAAIREYLTARGLSPSGPPFARRTVVAGKITVEAGYPVREPIQGDGYIRPSRLPECSAAIAVHYGQNGSVEQTYQAVREWLALNGYVADGPGWEVYLTDPTEFADPDRWHTEVVVPYREQAPWTQTAGTEEM